MLLKKYYSYLYYRCYELLGTMGSYNLEFVSLNLLSSIEILIVIITITRKLSHIIGATNSSYFIGITYVTLLMINAFLFMRKSFYKKIIERFSNESKKEKYAGRILLLSTIAFLVYKLF